jgi:hypothetical protein
MNIDTLAASGHNFEMLVVDGKLSPFMAYDIRRDPGTRFQRNRGQV